MALVRIVLVAMPGLERLGWQLALALAMVTMTLGNLLALWQDNVRRLLAYSSIAHAGYMLIGLAVGFAVAAGASEADNFDGVGATLVLPAGLCRRHGRHVRGADLSGQRAASASTRSTSWPGLSGRPSQDGRRAGGVHVLAHRPAALGRLLGQVHAVHRRPGGRRPKPRVEQPVALVPGAGRSSAR